MEMPAEETVEVADEVAVEGAEESKRSEDLDEATEMKAVATPKRWRQRCERKSQQVTAVQKESTVQIL